MDFLARDNDSSGEPDPIQATADQLNCKLNWDWVSPAKAELKDTESTCTIGRKHNFRILSLSRKTNFLP
jgi:hypothetical protein